MAEDGCYNYVHQLVGFIDIVDSSWIADDLPDEKLMPRPSEIDDEEEEEALNLNDVWIESGLNHLGGGGGEEEETNVATS